MAYNPLPGPQPWKHLDTPITRGVWNALGFPGPRPWIDTGPLYEESRHKAIGEQFNGSSDVALDTKVAQDLGHLPFGHTLGDRLSDQHFGRGLEARDRGLDALAVLIHEYAHTQQPMIIHKGLREGGATLYTEQNMDRVLKAMGLGGQPRANTGYKDRGYYQGIYPGHVSAILHMLGGKQFVEQRQFGR